MQVPRLPATLAYISMSLACLLTVDGLAAETDASLTNRIDRLERDLAALKDSSESMGDKAPDEKEQRSGIWSSLDVRLYGYVKVDATYDTSRVVPGNYMLYVEPEDTRDDDDEFHLTANQSRVGFAVTGPASETMQTSGVIEFDFYGSNASENKAKTQMRHACAKLRWPDGDLSLLAGQTWDIVSPLLPATLDYGVLYFNGNLGYRRPQVRLTKGLALGEDISLKLQAGIARTIGRTDPTGSETGEDAGWPTVQARVSATFPPLGAKPTVLGISGHYGTEEYDLDATGRNEQFESWSANLDLVQPVCEWLVIRGELFTGENLNAYCAGMGHGVNTATLEEISSRGGWVSASFGPWSRWVFNAGAGTEDVDSDDLSEGDRTLGSAVFANAVYSVNEHVQVGAEVSQWNTHYEGGEDADDTRLHATLIYKF